MKYLNLARATERYNDLMATVGREYSQIGTVFSESTDGWNIRDMVAEADYILSCYYEVGHCCEEMRHDANEKKIWISEVGKLKRFIKAYEPFIKEVKCKIRHCSNYDN